MLPEIRDYERLRAAFRWQIPARYNIGVDACDKWAAREPDKTALIVQQRVGDFETVTYGRLREQSNRLANALRALGIARGDRIAIILPQATETAIAHLAIYKLGGIALPLASLFGVEALSYRLGNAGARAAITNAAGIAKLSQIRNDIPELKYVLSIDGAADGALDFAETSAKASDSFTPVETSANEPALMIYTSGTTGPPKGALHGHRVLLGHYPGVQFPTSSFRSPATGCGRQRTGPGPAVFSTFYCRRSRSAFRWWRRNSKSSTRKRHLRSWRGRGAERLHPADGAAHAARRGQAAAAARAAHARLGRRIARHRDL